jgi:peptide-methionine (R)-S-oxide reductase
MKRILATSFSRRRLFAGGAATAFAAVTGAAKARVAAGTSSDFVYEITKTDEEWRAQLGDDDFAILREGFTEKPKSSPLWLEVQPGMYHCKGCDLPAYDGQWKVLLDKGWVFFYHAVPDAVLFGIDGKVPEYGAMSPGTAISEVHCRRCGSHLGHHLQVAGEVVHCINGASLNFIAQSA